MYLDIDNQTLDDLRIFSKRDRLGLFDLFNHTYTRGGESLLRELFKRPLSEPGPIRDRIRTLKHLHDQNVAFPFKASLFDSSEKYIDNPLDTDNKTGATLSDKDIQNGVHAVIDLFHQVKSFTSKPEIKSIPGFGQHLDTILAVLEDRDFAPVYEVPAGSKLSFGTVTAFDRLFRTVGRQKIQQLLEQIYRLDAYLSVAKIARDRQFTFPHIHEKGSSILRMMEVYHPELEQPIANSLEMVDGNTLMFLTGANMAGKSTLLRSIATAVYLAHLGFPVAAKQLELSVMDGLFTTINLPDNLGIGASHFYAEVLRVKTVAAELQKGKAIFVIFDELFRGTNVKDAHEATVDVALGFAEHTNSRFIISSHIVEAAEQLSKSPAVSFSYLPTKMEQNTPVYTYTLMPGVTDDRHGMIIIRNEGILDILKDGKKRAG